MSWTEVPAARAISTLARLELNCENKVPTGKSAQSRYDYRSDVDVAGTRRGSVTDAQASGQEMYAFAPSAEKSNTSLGRIVLNSSDLSWDIIARVLEVDWAVLALWPPGDELCRPLLLRPAFFGRGSRATLKLIGYLSKSGI